MSIREIVHFIDKREGVQLWLGWTFLMAFLILSVYLVDNYENEDERQLREAREIAEECKSLAMANDFVNAHKKIIELENCLKSTSYIDDRIEEYNTVYDYVFEAEAMYLCAKGDKESLDRLVFLLLSVPVKGVALPDGYKYEYAKRDGYPYACYDLSDEQVYNHNLFASEVMRFNQKCDKIINLALSIQQLPLADRIVELYKDVPSLISAQEGKHIIHYSKQAQNEGRNKIDKVKRRKD